MRLSCLPQFAVSFALFVIVFVSSTADCAQESAPANAAYKNPHLSPEQRVADLLGRHQRSQCQCKDRDDCFPVRDRHGIKLGH